MFWSPSDSPRGLMSICLMSRLAGWPAVTVIVLVVWSWPCAVTASAAPPIRAADAAIAIRIVQEALTNALTHAGPAQARVVVRYGTRDLELEITDDGRGAAAAAVAGGRGHGLVGRRERAALFGGHVRERRPARRGLRGARHAAAGEREVTAVRVLL